MHPRKHKKVHTKKFMAAKNAKLAKLIADTADKPDGIGCVLKLRYSCVSGIEIK